MDDWVWSGAGSDLSWPLNGHERTSLIPNNPKKAKTHQLLTENGRQVAAICRHKSQTQLRVYNESYIGISGGCYTLTLTRSIACTLSHTRYNSRQATPFTQSKSNYALFFVSWLFLSFSSNQTTGVMNFSSLRTICWCYIKRRVSFFHQKFE